MDMKAPILQMKVLRCKFMQLSGGTVLLVVRSRNSAGKDPLLGRRETERGALMCLCPLLWQRRPAGHHKSVTTSTLASRWGFVTSSHQ